MPLWNAIRARETWIGLAAAAVTAVLADALGAWAIVGGAAPARWAMGWVWGSWAVAGAAGVWIAARSGKGTALRALLICLLLWAAIWASSLAVSNGLSMSDGGWRVPASAAAGCALSGFLRAAGRKKSGRRRKKRSAGRRISGRR